jgi:pyrimidine operon attenuation protein/uracil phosphoribosyltransferase
LTTHVPADATARLLLDGEAIAKALSRIAHEVIERTDELENVALVGIQSRGAPLASRLRRLVHERSGYAIPVGALDITLPSRTTCTSL